MTQFTRTQRIISCILKGIVIIAAVVGTYISAYAGRHAFMGGSAVFKYFTIQSNLALALIALIGLVLLFSKRRIGTAWYVIRLVGAVSITLTGLVFSFVLAPTLGKHAWNFQNTLTHVVVPAAAVADFFVSCARAKLPRVSILFVTLPPLAYALYAGIGYLLKWEFSPGVHYPYFFLNWGSPAGAFGFSKQLPFMGCVWWILAILVLLMLLGSLYLAVLDRIRKRITRSS